MLNLADLRSRLAGRQTPAARVPAAPKSATPAQGDEKRRACQSLCLQCDARTPCTLGRLIG
jgi:hypothetical protein